MFKNLKKFVGEALLYGLSAIASRFIGVFLVPFYTKVFLPSDYGLISIFTNAYTLITILLVFALDNSTSRWYFDSENLLDKKKSINTWFWFFISVSFIAMIFFYFSADYLSYIFFKNDKVIILIIKLLATNLFFVVFSAVASNVLRFERKPYSTMILSLSITIVSVILSIFFVLYLKVGIVGIFISQLIAAILGAFISIYYLAKWLDSPVNFDFDMLIKMLNYSWPFIPATLAYWVVNLSGVFFIKYYFSESDVGLFQIGVSVASSIALFINAFQQAWPPFAYSIMNQNDAKNTYKLIFDLYVVCVLIFCVLISLFSKDILALLTNPKYYNSSMVSSILVYSYFSIGLISIADLGLSIMKKTKPLGFIMLISAALTIIFNLILVPRFGALGAALSICLAQLINPIYMFYKSQIVYPISFNFAKAILIFIFSAIFSFISINYLNVVSLNYFLIKFIFFLIFCGISIVLYRSLFYRIFSKVKTILIDG